MLSFNLSKLVARSVVVIHALCETATGAWNVIRPESYICSASCVDSVISTRSMFAGALLSGGKMLVGGGHTSSACEFISSDHGSQSASDGWLHNAESWTVTPSSITLSARACQPALRFFHSVSSRAVASLPQSSYGHILVGPAADGAYYLHGGLYLGGSCSNECVYPLGTWYKSTNGGGSWASVLGSAANNPGILAFHTGTIVGRSTTLLDASTEQNCVLTAMC